jgi:hypothetical protein
MLHVPQLSKAKGTTTVDTYCWYLLQSGDVWSQSSKPVAAMTPYPTGEGAPVRVTVACESLCQHQREGLAIQPLIRS